MRCSLCLTTIYNIILVFSHGENGFEDETKTLKVDELPVPGQGVCVMRFITPDLIIDEGFLSSSVVVHLLLQSCRSMCCALFKVFLMTSYFNYM